MDGSRVRTEHRFALAELHQPRAAKARGDDRSTAARELCSEDCCVWGKAERAMRQPPAFLENFLRRRPQLATIFCDWTDGLKE